MSKNEVNVAIGLIFCGDKTLVGWRTSDQHQGNKYEFAGGKIHPYETPKEACQREVLEEVGVDIEQWHIWDVIQHEYEDIIVNLNLFFSYLDDSIAVNAPWTWYPRQELNLLNFPKANDSIIERIIWPKSIQFSTEWINNQNTLLYWVKNIELQKAKLRYLILNLDDAQNLTLLQQQQLGAIHLNAEQLQHTKKLKVGVRYIATCNDAQALQHAQNIGCEAIFSEMSSPMLTFMQTEPDIFTLA